MAARVSKIDRITSHHARLALKAAQRRARKEGYELSHNQVAGAMLPLLTRANGERYQLAHVQRQLRDLLADPPRRGWKLDWLDAFAQVVGVEPHLLASPLYRARLRDSSS